MSNLTRRAFPVGLSRAPAAVLTVLLGTGIGIQACSDRTTGPTPPSTQSVVGTFTISAGSASMVQGGTAESEIAILRRGGFTGTVTLSVVASTAGVTATISPNVTTGTKALLNIVAGATVPAGGVTLTITGSADGLADQKTIAFVDIFAATSDTGTVTVDGSACPVGFKPTWFAFQDGAGPWTQIVSSSDIYHFNVASGKGGYAWVGRAGSGVSVSLASQTELTGTTILLCGGAPVPGLKTVTGSFAGLRVNDLANVGMGGAWADPEGYPVATTSFTLTGVRDGHQDLVAYRSNLSSDGIDDRIVIRRDQNIANHGSVGTVDFSGTESFAPATATLTIAGAGIASVGAFVMYDVGAQCSANVLSDLTSHGTGFAMRGVPAARQRATDFHRTGVFTTAGDFRYASESFHTLADRVIALPAALSPATVTAPPGGHKRLHIALTPPSDYQTVWLWYRGGTDGNGIDLHASFGWVGGTAVALTVPDFSGVTGWKSSFLPGSDTPVVWGLYASGANQEAAGGACAENARFYTTSVTGKS